MSSNFSFRTKRMPEPRLIFEQSNTGRIGCNVPTSDTPEVDLAATLGELREELHLPEVGELEMLRKTR